jgi:hypothetical protein
MFKKLFNAFSGKSDEVENTKNQLEETISQTTSPTRSFDPETLHGTHYDVADFDAEIEKMVANWKSSNTDVTQSDIDNAYHNFRRDLYKNWNNADTDEVIRWEMANSQKHKGMAASGFTKEDVSNPLLQPIHGITLKDYGAISAKMASGVDEATICNVLGIEPAVFQEVNAIWCQRMQEDTSFTVTTLFGQYFGEAESHPKLGQLSTNITEEGQVNLEKMKSDRYFYEELCGARQAAYEYGMDGAQWILENFGIGLGEMQSVAMKYMEEQNKNFDSNAITHYLNYQNEKTKEYAARFAKEQGGNVADDIDF